MNTAMRDVNHISEARKTLFGNVETQHRQCKDDYTRKYAHGDATLGPLTRSVYFDIGGEYDLVDD